jgi:linoleoyl-CoA desaturase
MNKYTFGKGRSPFFKVLKERVDEYLTEKKLHPAGNKKLLWKSIIQILCSIVLYVVLVFFTPSSVISIALCTVLGVNLAVIGFNVMHEGGHQTFSRHVWVNRTAAYVLNVLGGIAYYWKVKHNINHHTYTNIEGMDSDIDVRPFMRLHHGQPWHRYHRFQHIYWIFLYAISYLAWIFYEDFLKYFSGKININGERKKLPLNEHFIFWFTKIMYVLVYMVIPILFVGWWLWLTGFLIITFSCGLATSIVFQLAHVVESTQFHTLDDRHENRYDWAVHQMVSTCNFSTGSKVMHWLLGGLNFQIEHHLFPRISHIHYPVISRLIKDTCRQYNIVYNEYASIFQAISSHINHLRKLGRITS